MLDFLQKSYLKFLIYLNFSLKKISSINKFIVARCYQIH
jgi:hypothetical protein